MLPLIPLCSHGLVPIDSIDAQSLTTALLSAPKPATFQAGLASPAHSFKSMRRALSRELVKKGLARQAGGELENFGRINS